MSYDRLSHTHSGLFGYWLHPEQDAQYVEPPHQELVDSDDEHKGTGRNDEPFDRVRYWPSKHKIADDKKDCLMHDVKGEDSLVGIFQ